MKEGTAFETVYTLTGTEPITVTVAAKNAKGTAVNSFSVNTASHTVNAPGSLPVGSYTVTVTAKNSAGESSKSFTLEVTAAAPVTTPPELTLESARFIIKQGSPFQTSYSLTGSEPITVTVKASGPDGGTVSGFTVNTAAHTIKAIAELSPALYTVTVTAKTAPGELQVL